MKYPRKNKSDRWLWKYGIGLIDSKLIDELQIYVNILNLILGFHNCGNQVHKYIWLRDSAIISPANSNKDL